VRVLFWGTPDFGVPSLEALRTRGHEIVGVVTNPDRPAGRGRQMAASAVKRWAEAAGVPVLQPERPRGRAFLDELLELAPDISVVAAYGHILGEEVLDLPPHGSLNVHASLLPALRGAAPINWAIIRGHAESGVTIMRMVLALDAGPMLAQAPCPIGTDTTAGALFESLAHLGARALVDCLDDMAAGRAVETVQDEAAATYAPKLDRDAARLDWSLDASRVSCWMRGCDPWPGAWTMVDGDPVQCFSPSVEPAPPASPGTILEADPRTGLLVATGEGAIRIREVKPAGRRRMDAAAWIRGRRPEGVRLC